MKFSKDDLCDNIVHVLMIALISSITVFTSYAWGRYVMLACLVSILGVGLIKNKGKYYIYGLKYAVFISMFALYTVLSAFWAKDSVDSITQGKTLFEMLIMVFVIYNYHYEISDGVKQILDDIKLSSFFITFYSVFYYGIDNLIEMARLEERMENTYANVNTIGMLVAVGTLIQIGEMIKNKKVNVMGLFCIPSIILIALTQSRKALVMLVVGICLILWIENIYSKNLVKTILKSMVYVIFGILVLYFVFKLPFFTGVLDRMGDLWNGFTGNGATDNSSYIRNRMMMIGWEQFKETPLLGMGMGNPHYLSLAKLGKDAYLHNNFIELLAGGGIIGFILYYSMYLYLIMKFWRYRGFANKEYGICLVLMLVLLIMDYGRVSYYSKNQYIYLVLYFLEVECLRKNAYRKRSEI